MDRHMKVNTVKHRTHSLFRQGYYYNGRLPTLKRDNLKKLLECFTDLLAEQQMLTDILGFI